ncbi:hypothetical protein RJ55_04263 [Drechmeria coniospora]|nr:hypothetical protein RJ55_04263 [Drechmeria coniospora]
MKQDNVHYECGTCCKSFPAGRQARDRHCRDKGHSPPCSSDGGDWGYFSIEHGGDWGYFIEPALEESVDDADDSQGGDFECTWCGGSWWTMGDCIRHEHAVHCFCRRCDRFFRDQNCLKMHLQSRAHVGRAVECPFCHDHFTTAGGLCHHVESGSCSVADHLNRRRLHKVVQSVDPNGWVSKDAHPRSGPYEREPDERAWNGDEYECHICHAEFGKLSSLSQHLSSPVHQQPLYHCPAGSCGADFKSLGALVSHLESESCGAARSEDVQRGIGDLVSGLRLTII